MGEIPLRKQSKQALQTVTNNTPVSNHNLGKNILLSYSAKSAFFVNF
jgi:hypothetical protein